MATKSKDTKKAAATPKKVAAKTVVAKKVVAATKKAAYTVRLSNAGNPDHKQDPTKTLPCVKNKTVRVASVDEAKQACLAYIKDNDLGAGNWTGGEITDVATGKRVANVAYNGKVLYDVEAEVIDPKPTKKKTVAKKTSTVAASQKVTVASIVGELLAADPKVNYETALAAVVKKIPTSKMSKASMSWYRSKFRKDGAL